MSLHFKYIPLSQLKNLITSAKNHAAKSNPKTTHLAEIQTNEVESEPKQDKPKSEMMCFTEIEVMKFEAILVKDSSHDPRCETEYAADIYEYLSELEVFCKFIPLILAIFNKQQTSAIGLIVNWLLKYYIYYKNAKYSQSANEIPRSYLDQSQLNRREMTVDWLVGLHSQFGFVQETFFLTVSLFDRFLLVSLLRVKISHFPFNKCFLYFRRVPKRLNLNWLASPACWLRPNTRRRSVRVSAIAFWRQKTSTQRGRSAKWS
jgi:Cyclin, N-terminal domain